MSGPRILLVDDHRLIAVALSVALHEEGFDALVSPTVEHGAVIELARHFEPACVLLDLHLGSDESSGLDLVAPLRGLGTEVVMLTSEQDELVLADCLEAGALGWVPKDAELEAVGAAVTCALRGQPLLGRTVAEQLRERAREHRRQMRESRAPFEQLSRRESVVLGALMDGRSAEEIANQEGVSLATVRTQIRSMLLKLGVHSQLAAVARARRAGWSISDTTGTPVHQS